MVLSEAGAAGLPLVATDVAGVPEIVRDGATGLVVPPDDVAALTRALERLADDPQLRARLGAGAQALVEESFDAERNTLSLARLLADVAESRARAR
jgi:glycosyltransferase involved in cell wall biosynthesis